MCSSKIKVNKFASWKGDLFTKRITKKDMFFGFKKKHIKE